MSAHDPALARKPRYPMDTYDGGRAAAEPEHALTSELGWIRRRQTDPCDEDIRAVALAVIALTGCSD